MEERDERRVHTGVSSNTTYLQSFFTNTLSHMEKVFCWLPHLASPTLSDVLVFHNSDMASSPTFFSLFLLQFEQNSSATGQGTDDLILMWISQHF